MMEHILRETPTSIKLSLDVGAAGVGIIHVLGWWNTYIGSIAATAGLIWILIQAYYFFKNKDK